MNHPLQLACILHVVYRWHTKSLCGCIYFTSIVTFIFIPNISKQYQFLFPEEILSSNSALWMSNDGHMILYASFNDTLVEESRFPWYGSVSEDRLYPDIRSLRYPKPGTNNPQVTLYVADLADPGNIRTKPVRPPLILQQNS